MCVVLVGLEDKTTTGHGLDTPGYIPFRYNPATTFPRPDTIVLTSGINVPVRPESNGSGSGALIPIPERKCQLVILFPALRTVVVLKAGIRV